MKRFADGELGPEIQAFEAGASQGQALLGLMRPHVARVARRYPDTYFADGRRDEDALEALLGGVFTSCARVPKARPPFDQRTPFRTFVEEELPDPPIRYHSFYAPLAVTREVLRDQYAQTVRADPELRRRDRIYRSLAAVLPTAALEIERAGGSSLWTHPGTGPRPVRTIEQVTHRLAGSSLPLPALVPEILSQLGAPVSRSQLAHLIADIQQSHQVAPAAGAGTDERMDVRGAMVRAWHALEPLDQALLAGMAQGLDSKALVALDPRLGSAAGLTRALRRIGDGFVAPLAALAGQTEVQPKPKAVVGHVLELLTLLLPELEARHAAL